MTTINSSEKNLPLIGEKYYKATELKQPQKPIIDQLKGKPVIVQTDYHAIVGEEGTGNVSVKVK